MNSVRARSRFCSVSARSAPSTLATKCMRGPSPAKGESARDAIAGPRSEPPMPILTTSLNGAPVAPRMSPERTARAKAKTFSRSASISGRMFSPPTRSGRDERSRRAICMAARLSVLLMRSPENNASRRASRSRVCANEISSAIVSRVTLCLEKSKRKSSSLTLKFLKRAGSSAKRSSVRVRAKAEAWNFNASKATATASDIGFSKSKRVFLWDLYPILRRRARNDFTPRGWTLNFYCIVTEGCEIHICYMTLF